MNKKSYKTLILCSLMAFTASAQNGNDSKLLNLQQAINQNFPRTRTLDVQLEGGFPDDYKVKMPDYDYWEKGEQKPHTSVIVTGNYDILQHKGLHIAAGGSYQYDHLKFKNGMTNTMGDGAILHAKSEDFHLFNVNATAGYGTQLFGKITFFSGTIFNEFSQEGYERWGCLLTAHMILISSADEYLSVGLVGFTNHASRWPVFPTVSYMRRLSADWAMDISFPGYCYMRRLFSNENRLSIGAELNGNHHYLNPDTQRFGADELYLSKIAIKLGAAYEQRVGKHLYLTVKGGYNFPFRCKIYDTDHLMHDELGKYSEDASFYINLGFSYNL